MNNSAFKREKMILALLTGLTLLIQIVSSTFIAFERYYNKPNSLLPSIEFWIESQSHHLFVIPILLFTIFHFGFVFPKQLQKSFYLFGITLCLALINIFIGVVPAIATDMHAEAYNNLKFGSSLVFQGTFLLSLFLLCKPAIVGRSTLKNS